MITHQEKSEYLYGVDLRLFLKREVKFINKRIDLLEDNLKATMKIPVSYDIINRMGYVDFNKAFIIQKAIKFWNDELKILRKKL